MFGLFSRKTSIAESGFLQGMSDRHSHLLPGVDDGFRTMEESLAALQCMEAAGVAELWLTPHIMEDVPNATEALRLRYAELTGNYKGKIKLRLAAENMIDNLFLDRWEKQDLLTMEGNMLLVETSYFTPPMELNGILGEMINKGFTPVLAHPERYKYMDRSHYVRLRKAGVLFQLNLGSVAGIYSPATQKNAEWLLSGGMYDFAGSDTHNLRFWQKTVAAPLPRTVISRLLSIPHRNIE